MIRLNLFTYRDLFDWLDDPFTPPKTDPPERQLPLSILDSSRGVILATASRSAYSLTRCSLVIQVQPFWTAMVAYIE
jgi:hypothetical protein